jgi:hypothetical protein
LGLSVGVSVDQDPGRAQPDARKQEQWKGMFPERIWTEQQIVLEVTEQ